NIPVTRTPDAHFLTETRYNGTKVVAVSPDYADNVKHADEWLAPHPGTDGALAMAMGHVILREFLVEREVPYCQQYLRTSTDAPFLVSLREHADGGLVPDGFLTAADLGHEVENAGSKTVLLDSATGEPVVPGGSV
ncbi:molybdopterin-dependent oxidoreductase, partial [Clavibacter michiganensis]|uniref:molybdopterin-dependent oxidoreductase n=1 Tax=Clavibacter michiganensis TaxID=28447 RepID=UPI00292FB3D2